MLIKIGPHTLVAENVVAIYETPETRQVYFVGGYCLCFSESEITELRQFLEDAAKDQQTLKSQIEAVNKQHAELQAKAQEIAAYEQQLMQKAAQVDAAYAAMQQQKSPVILPPGFGRKRG